MTSSDTMDCSLGANMRPEKAVMAVAKADSCEDRPQYSTAQSVYIFSVVTMAMFNSTTSSSLPGGASPYISSHFMITDAAVKLLPSTTYLVGYIMGPLVFAPLSEQFGRRNILLLTSSIFLVASIGCALSPTYIALVVFRYFAGVGGAAPISIIGGVMADIFPDSATRGSMTAAYTVLTTIGTVMSPAIFGVISWHSGWRWSFWTTSILGGVVTIAIYLLPETYEPYIRRQEASKCLTTLERTAPSLTSVLLRSIKRPLLLLCTEQIVLLSSLYCTLVFAVLFLLYPGYQHIFHDIYGLPYQLVGLAFVPMCIGTVLTLPICILYDSHRRRSAKRGKTWALSEETQRLPLACIGGPLLTISLFWLGWTSNPEAFHVFVPMSAGLPFGIGLNLVLSALFNYLTDSYGIYAASALAAASCMRSIGGALLPLATETLFKELGVQWGISVLGFVSLALVPVPFVYVKYGERIREGSKLCVSKDQRVALQQRD